MSEEKIASLRKLFVDELKPGALAMLKRETLVELLDRIAELEQECKDRQGTEDSLVDWNESLAAALREAKEMLVVVNRALPGSMMTTRLEVDETIEAIDAALGGVQQGKGEP